MTNVKEATKAAIFRLIGYRPQQVSVSAWDREYRDGEWKYLEKIGSLAGQVSILGYCQFLAPDSILDVGCGAGLLAAKLKVLPYKSYLGVDISAEAIAQARKLQDARTQFAVTDANQFDSGACFDVIIFNQSMNYMPNPSKSVVHYSKFLTPKGRIIVSMCDSARARAAWPLVTKGMTVEDAMTFVQSEGRGTTKVLLPRAA
ncbi:MAG: class I SAM-dependent methyltransferase [Rhizomicrobium sp.]